MNNRIVIGISGASGSIYGVRILETLRKVSKSLKLTTTDSSTMRWNDTKLDYETHLVISRAGKITIDHEITKRLEDITSLADFYYSEEKIGEKIASSSFKTLGMIIAPCSIKTMSEIASGVTSNLLTRAADVTLKERRKLVLMVRESPLHLGHLQNMLKLTEMGAIIAPPVPAFYIKPKSLENIINHSISKVLDLFDIKLPNLKEWQGV
ncbi:UbiX family flavin prenyltransferase [Wolbachia endosymbiont of Dirofilaria (Dirofilaria) immitis]|uniref:UbiX family flavin prenyltransferase n=1 Tax=Wolbachia endosymbiont of Dirofilaria (Dirofilaria) immitis TaxID=1812115 RepID=UPI00158B7E85|nr:UbiX family flavin prenyltransferase [Wolbachia endosymbiont of Dirofilaria (Dirofilaria) immitis]QKX02535.1 UbiX family flavin prenyltransferase [Wolbachia endosymbiont of Dirofilaria (Dirofilaria) immitis]